MKISFFFKCISPFHENFPYMKSRNLRPRGVQRVAPSDTLGDNRSENETQKNDGDQQVVEVVFQNVESAGRVEASEKDVDSVGEH